MQTCNDVVRQKSPTKALTCLSELIRIRQNYKEFVGTQGRENWRGKTELGKKVITSASKHFHRHLIQFNVFLL